MENINPDVIRINVGEALKESIREAVDGLGGFSDFVREGDKVLLKPNFNTGDPFPASSDMDFLAAAADLFHENGAVEVTLGESSMFRLKTRAVMEDAGIRRLLEGRPWLSLVMFDEGDWVMKKCVPNATYMKRVSVPDGLEGYDRVIFLPCCKTHKYARFTGALKLSVGMMRPRERLALHALGHLQERIAELASVFSPDLVIMDARKCFISGGPAKGDVREPGLILASTDRVAIDSEGVRMIQQYEGNTLADVSAEDLVQIRHARYLGVDKRST